jgi:hypothetical protein
LPCTVLEAWKSAPLRRRNHQPRLLGSMRRKDTDHLIVLNEKHMLQILANVSSYYSRGASSRFAWEGRSQERPQRAFRKYCCTCNPGRIRSSVRTNLVLGRTTLTATRQSSIVMLWNQVVWGMSESWLALAPSMALRRLYEAARRRTGSRLPHCLDLRPIDTSHSEDAGEPALGIHRKARPLDR